MRGVKTMRIMLRTCFEQDMKSVLARDGLVSSSFDLDSYFWIDAESQMFERLLDLTQHTSGFRLTSEMQFDAGELGSVNYYQLVSRKTVKESSLDFSVTIANLHATDFLVTGDRSRIKLLKKIALSKIDLKPNMIGSLGEWAEEFIVTDLVAGVFRKCALSGFDTLPIFNPKTLEDHQNYFQLFAENILPPAVRDLTVIELEAGFDAEKQLRHLGCLSYETESGGGRATDFNRTAEAWSNNHLPFWVVSKSVVQCFRQNKLKGWAFRPVLDAQGDLYAEYIKKWTLLRHKISLNPRNRF
jgi:hypothetical protein